MTSAVAGHPRAAVGRRRGGGHHPAYVYLFALAVAAQAFSGSWHLYASPIPVDRVLLALACLALVVHPDLQGVRRRLRPIHLLMLAAVSWCIGSLIWFERSEPGQAVFALLDSFGIVPFLLFLLAPVVFASAARCDVLAATLTWLGLYLGWVSVAEGLGLHALVFPSTIVQPDHTHFERALGPSMQVASNGLALLGCAVFAGVHAARRVGSARVLGIVSLVLCLAGAFFTLTRSIWLAAMIGGLAVVLLERRLHRPALVAAGVTVILAGVLVAVAPSITETVTERAGTSRSVFDRLNANDAALRVVAARPLEGVGYGRFHEVEADWIWQDPTYPITNVGIDVHNVVLGHAAELGLVGLTLWLGVVVCAVRAAIAGRHRQGLRTLRLAALAYGLAWGTVSMLVPITYALPTTLLWLTLGIVSDPERLGWPVTGHLAQQQSSTPRRGSLV